MQWKVIVVSELLEGCLVFYILVPILYGVWLARMGILLIRSLDCSWSLWLYHWRPNPSFSLEFLATTLMSLSICKAMVWILILHSVVLIIVGHMVMSINTSSSKVSRTEIWVIVGFCMGCGSHNWLPWQVLLGLTPSNTLILCFGSFQVNILGVNLWVSICFVCVTSPTSWLVLLLEEARPPVVIVGSERMLKQPQPPTLPSHPQVNLVGSSSPPGPLMN